jgi:molybdopterin converting factor small subunit
MPGVRVKLNHWLRERMEPTSPEEISIQVPEGESINGLVRRLMAENGVFRGLAFDEQSQDLLANVLVIHNGWYVNPYDRSQVLLREGDELMFLPMFTGG